MENKYYTPEIEEFYVGFEYEQNSFIPIFNPDGKWEKQIYRGQLLSNTRVKYLDKEDIESCGWKFESENILSDGSLLPKIVKLGFSSIGTGKIWLSFNEDTKMVRIRNVHKIPYTIFMGKVLNISELRFQMKRLSLK